MLARRPAAAMHSEQIWSTVVEDHAGVYRRRLEEAIKSVMEQQIGKGTQIGMSVSVFLRGEELWGKEIRCCH